MAEFKDSLPIGKHWENKFLDDVLKTPYPKSIVIDGYFKGYDVEVRDDNGDKKSGVEVKCDIMSNVKGNFVVEVFMKNPSGLSTTTAETWCFTDGEKWFMISPSKIWECIYKNQYKVARFIGNGDTQLKYAYLIKKEHIAELSVIRNVKK